MRRIRLIPEFYDFIEEPDLLARERVHYLRLRNALDQELQPTSFSGCMEVVEIAAKILEKQRFRQGQVALINNPAALADLLGLVFGDNVERARAVALHYFGKDTKKARQAAESIEQSGLSASQIEGHAIVAQADSFKTLDQLIHSREDFIARTIKRATKRRDQRAKIPEPRDRRSADLRERTDCIAPDSQNDGPAVRRWPDRRR